eukprot:2008917-Rhodomonas_salina.1
MRQLEPPVGHPSPRIAAAWELSRRLREPKSGPNPLDSPSSKPSHSSLCTVRVKSIRSPGHTSSWTHSFAFDSEQRRVSKQNLDTLNPKRQFGLLTASAEETNGVARGSPSMDPASKSKSSEHPPPTRSSWLLKASGTTVKLSPAELRTVPAATPLINSRVPSSLSFPVQSQLPT